MGGLGDRVTGAGSDGLGRVPAGRPDAPQVPDRVTSDHGDAWRKGLLRRSYKMCYVADHLSGADRCGASGTMRKSGGYMEGRSLIEPLAPVGSEGSYRPQACSMARHSMPCQGRLRVLCTAFSAGPEGVVRLYYRAAPLRRGQSPRTSWASWGRKDPRQGHQTGSPDRVTGLCGAWPRELARRLLAPDSLLLGGRCLLLRRRSARVTPDLGPPVDLGQGHAGPRTFDLPWTSDRVTRTLDLRAGLGLRTLDLGPRTGSAWTRDFGL